MSSTLLRSSGSPVRWQALGDEHWEARLGPGFAPTLRPSPPQQETAPEFPCTFLPPTPAPTPPRPPPGPATLAPPRPLIVPKAERLSPPAHSGKEGFRGGRDARGWRKGKEERGTPSEARTRGTGQWDPLPCVVLSVGVSVPATGGERRLSGDLSSARGPGTLSVCVSPPQPILSRGRPDSNKVALALTPRSVCYPEALPCSLLGSPHYLPPKTESRRITHISAEQKRRFNIKLGFDTLHGLVSTLSAQPSLKVSLQRRPEPPEPAGLLGRQPPSPHLLRPTPRTLWTPGFLLPPSASVGPRGGATAST